MWAEMGEKKNSKHREEAKENYRINAFIWRLMIIKLNVVMKVRAALIPVIPAFAHVNFIGSRLKIWLCGR